MKIPFLKMSGAGNDFVVVDRMEDASAPDWKAVVPAMCDRHEGIGADGVLLLTPSTSADFTMEYYNADGSSGSMCGNGGRCVSAYMMGLLGRTEVSFMAAGRPYSAAMSGRGVKLRMDDPGLPKLHLPFTIRGADIVGHFIDTGSPHLVILGDSVGGDARSVVETGREIRRHEAFTPSGTNVDFIRITGKDRITMRTYERGVEDETLACGTGAVAAALIYSILEGKEGSGSVRITPLSGEEMVVTFHRTGMSFRGITLDGPAEVTFSGTYDTDRGGAR